MKKSISENTYNRRVILFILNEKYTFVIAYAILCDIFAENGVS